MVGDTVAAVQLLAASPGLASGGVEDGATRQNATAYYFQEIQHYLYAGDTALHVAGAAYRPDLARRLVDAGADVRAKNRRGAEPLHYAVDGGPGSSTWNPDAQAATVAYLIEAGADPNATDRSGVTPLHRAVRNRCAAAVQAPRPVVPIRDSRTRADPRPWRWRRRTRAGAGAAHWSRRRNRSRSCDSRAARRVTIERRRRRADAKRRALVDGPVRAAGRFPRATECGEEIRRDFPAGRLLAAA